jgi:RimJ/RimL family protein N-acetyltransferase
MTTSINWHPTHLENNLIKLTPITPDDFETLFEVASDPLIWEQHPTKDRYKREVFQKFFDGAIEGGTAFLIIDKATNKVIGSTRYYDYKAEIPSIAIGYTFLARAFWGGKHNHSAKKLLLDYAFQFVDKVYFHIGAANTRSQIAIGKIGAAKVGEVDFDYYGTKLLHFEYVISKDNWSF